jgi:hypothetical protein
LIELATIIRSRSRDPLLEVAAAISRARAIRCFDSWMDQRQLDEASFARSTN